jgi:hypothetical protein
VRELSKRFSASQVTAYEIMVDMRCVTDMYRVAFEEERLMEWIYL